MDSGETNCNFLPDDLLEGILSRMPVRDLLRMRCISKSWRALIDDSSFISMHHRAQYAMCKENGDVPRFLWESSCIGLLLVPNCYLLSKQQGDDIVLNLNSDLERDKSSVFTIDPSYIKEYVSCRGSANGVICLEQWCYDQKLRRICISCGLWNPATRDFRMISYPNAPDHKRYEEHGRQITIVGFMFHTISNDLKIMTKTRIVSDKLLAYEIYSLNTNSWKRLEQPLLLGCLAFISRSSVMDACLNGVNYWIARVRGSEMHPQLAQHHMYWVLSFDMSTEIFKFSDLPQVDWDCLSSPGGTKYDIGLYKESLAVFVTRIFFPELVGSVYIWVATEFDEDDFGVPLAWQCMFSSRQFDCMDIYGPRIMTARMDGDLLLLINGELCLYNTTTDTISSFRISIASSHSYVVSLFPLSRRVVQG